MFLSSHAHWKKPWGLSSHNLTLLPGSYQVAVSNAIKTRHFLYFYLFSFFPVRHAIAKTSTPPVSRAWRYVFSPQKLNVFTPTHIDTHACITHIIYNL